MYPDILNYDKLVELLGDFKAPMGCRSFLPSWKNDEGQLENNGRCNLGVVTLNVPRIAIEADGNMQQFWDIFENACNYYMMHLCIGLKDYKMLFQITRLFYIKVVHLK